MFCIGDTAVLSYSSKASNGFMAFGSQQQLFLAVPSETSSNSIATVPSEGSTGIASFYNPSALNRYPVLQVAQPFRNTSAVQNRILYQIRSIALSSRLTLLPSIVDT